jgi:hypothetical protein
MSGKTCYAIGCEKSVNPSRLMCRSCWRLVPKDLQLAVYAAHQNRMNPDYFKACQAARAAVSQKRMGKDSPGGKS